MSTIYRLGKRESLLLPSEYLGSNQVGVTTDVGYLYNLLFNALKEEQRYKNLLSYDRANELDSYRRSYESRLPEIGYVNYLTDADIETSFGHRGNSIVKRVPFTPRIG